MNKLIATIILIGILYLIGVFLSSNAELNPLLWPWYGKIIFLIFVISIIKTKSDN